MSVAHVQYVLAAEDPRNYAPDYAAARCRICRCVQDLVRAGEFFVCRVACWSWR